MLLRITALIIFLCANPAYASNYNDEEETELTKGYISDDQSLCILVVDDVRLCLTMTAKVVDDVLTEVQVANSSIIKARNAGDALNLFLKHKPHIVITDLEMPNGMNGDELAKKMRSTDWGSNTDVKLILLSAAKKVESKKFRRKLSLDYTCEEEGVEDEEDDDEGQYLSDSETELHKDDPPFNSMFLKNDFVNIKRTLKQYIQEWIG